MSRNPIIEAYEVLGRLRSSRAKVLERYPDAYCFHYEDHGYKVIADGLRHDFVCYPSREQAWRAACDQMRRGCGMRTIHRTYQTRYAWSTFAVSDERMRCCELLWSMMKRKSEPSKVEVIADKANHLAIQIYAAGLGCLDSPLAGDVELLCEAAETTPIQCECCEWDGAYSDLDFSYMGSHDDYIALVVCPNCGASAGLAHADCGVSV